MVLLADLLLGANWPGSETAVNSSIPQIAGNTADEPLEFHRLVFAVMCNADHLVKT